MHRGVELAREHGGLEGIGQVVGLVDRGIEVVGEAADGLAAIERARDLSRQPVSRFWTMNGGRFSRTIRKPFSTPVLRDTLAKAVGQGM